MGHWHYAHKWVIVHYTHKCVIIHINGSPGKWGASTVCCLRRVRILKHGVLQPGAASGGSESWKMTCFNRVLPPAGQNPGKWRLFGVSKASNMFPRHPRCLKREYTENAVSMVLGFSKTHGINIVFKWSSNCIYDRSMVAGRAQTNKNTMCLRDPSNH